MKKNNNKNNFFSNFKLYSDVYKAGSMISLSNAKHLKLVLKSVGWRIATLCFLSTKEINRFRLLHNFGVFIIKMNKNHGEVYTVKYLKACQLAIQKKLGGSPFSSLREVEPDFNFPRLSKSGLPSIIKLTDRASICNNSFNVIRFYLSLFSLYRVIKIPFNPKLNTITDSFGGSQFHLDDFNIWLNSNSSKILTKFSELKFRELTSTRLQPILKGSPLGPKSYSHLISAYYSIKENSFLYENIKAYIDLTKSSNIWTTFSNIQYCTNKYKLRYDIKPLGKLSFKEEAAGKLRVFAMVDIITQSLLKPLHDSLFNLFKKIPNDCTHDQNRGFKLAQELSLKFNCSYGFDLSAATDRLPISSQVSVLNSLFGNKIGDIWKNILVGRDYVILKNDYNIEPQSVRYAVGQPMGALSSWAMLNLVHHMMVQFIAVHLDKVPKGSWYSDYVILGDDLVLFDKDIADRYLSLCKQIGVSINLSKSVISEHLPVLEFAKRTSIKGVDVSALSFKEMLSSNTFFGRLAVTTRLLHNGWGSDKFKLLIIGNKVSISKKIDNLIYPLVGFVTQLYQNNIIPLSSVLSLVTNRDKPLAFFGRNINWMTPKIITNVVKEYLKTGEFKTSMLPIRERFYSEYNSITFKVALLDRIDRLVHKIESKTIQEYWVDTLDRGLINTDSLENWYKAYPNSLELDKPLSDRSYYNDPSFLVFKKMFIECAPIAAAFSTNIKGSIVDIRLLRLGMDIDLQSGRGTSSFIDFFLSKRLNEYKTVFNYWNSIQFVDMTLEYLIKSHEKLVNNLKLLTFAEPDPNLNKEVINNPLKVLDFLKDHNNPIYKVNSDFVKFDGKITDSTAYVDKPRGFKPFFDFSKESFKPKITVLVHKK